MFLQTIWRLLAVDGRGLLEILKDPNPEAKTSKRDQAFLYSWWPMIARCLHEEVAEENAGKEDKRKHIHDSFFRFNTYWCHTVGKLRAGIKCTSDASRAFIGDCDFLMSVIFWLYASCLFAMSFSYFFARIFAYRFGFIEGESRPTKQKRRLFYKQRKKTRWMFKRRKYLPSEQRKSPTRHRKSLPATEQLVCTTVLNIDDRVRGKESVHFDTDSKSAVCDNSANVHVCNQKSMYVGELRPIESHKVATIGGKGHSPAGIGTVKWSWNDDCGHKHEYLVENVLFFPQSPINILSVTEFAKQLNDKEGTGIDTKQLRSRFYWDQNKYFLTIHHPPSNLPEFSINEGFCVSMLCQAMLAKVINVKSHSKHSCCFIKFDDDCVRDSESHVLTTDVKQELFEVGETLFYAKEGWSGLVKVKSLALDENGVLRIVVMNSNGEDITTTREFLRSPGNPDIGWIPTSVPEYQSSAKEISDEDMTKITSPVHLSPLQQEFLSVHHKLFHLPFTIMLRLSKFGVLPKRFLKLRKYLPRCVSCMFGQSHRQPWRNKASASNVVGSLRKDSESKSDDRIATDQIVSAQPGLVP